MGQADPPRDPGAPHRDFEHLPYVPLPWSDPGLGVAARAAESDVPMSHSPENRGGDRSSEPPIWIEILRGFFEGIFLLPSPKSSRGGPPAPAPPPPAAIGVEIGDEEIEAR